MPKKRKRKKRRRIEARWLERKLPPVAAWFAKSRARAAKFEAQAAFYDAGTSKRQRPMSGRSSGRRVPNGAGNPDYDFPAIREYSATLYRNNPIYRGVLRRARDFTLGPSGFRIMPKTPDKGLDDALRAAFEAYAGRREHGGGGEWSLEDHTLQSAQRLMLLGMDRDGDALAYRSDEGWQFFESWQLGTPFGYQRQLGPGRPVVDGVEFAAGRRHARYWVSSQTHKGYHMRGDVYGLAADHCFHATNPEWFSLPRGLPALHTELPNFEDLAGYLEAERVGARAAACIMAVVKSDDPNASDALGLPEDPVSGTVGEDLPYLNLMTPGMVARIDNDESVQLLNSNRPGTAFEGFVRTIQRLSTISIGLPMELAFLDFSRSNFSTAKMIVQEASQAARIRVEPVRAFTACVYRDWLRNQTEIPMPAGMSEAEFAKFDIAGKEPYAVQVEKLAQARVLDLAAGHKSITEIIEERGGDLEDVLRDHAKEMRLAKDIASDEGLEAEAWREVLLGVQRNMQKEFAQVLAAADTNDPEPEPSE